MHCLAGLDMGRHSVMLRQPAPVLRQCSVSFACSLVNVGCYKYRCATHGYIGFPQHHANHTKINEDRSHLYKVNMSDPL